jgi:NADH:ubiquinone oxidoreductase subunit 2 (subunit N)
MLVNSVVSVFYYLVVPREMFLRDAADRSRLRVPVLVTAVVALAMVAIVAIFVLPSPFTRLAELSSLVGLGP